MDQAAARLRLIVAVFALAAVIAAGHVAARPVAATDCVTYYCASVTLHLSGTGNIRVVDDQGELDCYYNGSSQSGACSVQYYWIGQMSSTLPVTVTATAAADSYVCGFNCSDPGGIRVVGLSLNRDDSFPVYFTAYLANVQTTTVESNSNGSGKITSSPAGLNCTVTSGVNSGTCKATWYFKDSLTVTYTATPTFDSAACELTISNCASVGQPKQSGIVYTSSGGGGTGLFFLQAHPILTAAVTGQGTVVSSPSGISCPSSCSRYFAPGTNVTLNAAAKSGYVFQSWTGACAGYGSTCNLSLGSADVSTTAVFAQPATPAPTARTTPTPTGTPGTTPAPGGSAHPGPTHTPAAATAAPATSPGVPAASAGSTPGVASSPPASMAPDASGAVAIGSTALPTSPTALGAGAGSSPAPVAGETPAQSAGIDPMVLFMLVVIAVLVLALGFALGARRGRAAT